jgi:hypothetical protein
MKVICGFIVLHVHHKQHIFWGQTFALWRPNKKSEKIGEIPQTFESKKIGEKLLIDNTVFGSQIKGELIIENRV